MKLAKICPCCGADIVLDEPILMNDFSMMGAGFPLFYRDQRINLTHGEALVVWALLKAYPEHLNTDVLAERIGCDEEVDSSSTIKVLVHRIRRKFEFIGAPQAISTIKRHHSYVWDPIA